MDLDQDTAATACPAPAVRQDVSTLATPQLGDAFGTNSSAGPSPVADTNVFRSVSHRSRSLRQDTILSGVLFLLVATLVQRFVGTVRGVVFCQWMTPEELGSWDVSNGFLLFAGPLVALGLPGMLTRYAGQFRRHGQLRYLLVRIACGLSVVAGFAAGAIVLGRKAVGEVLFGRSDMGYLVAAIAGGLTVMVVFSMVLKFFNALLFHRIASLMNSSYSLLFTLFGCLLLLFWRPTALSVVISHAAAMLGTCLLVSYWLWQVWHGLPATGHSGGKSAPWSKMASFALGLCVTNTLSAVFELVARWMIVHYSGLAPQAALALVGQYYAARMVPTLMINFAVGFAFQLLPHVIEDWEAGRRDDVNQRFDFVLRVTAVSSFGLATLFLAIGPQLFELVFGDKFRQGMTVLHLSVASGVVFTMFSVGKVYLWCREQAWLVSTMFVAALIVNIGGNLAFLPRYGLMGAAMAHVIAVSLLLGTMYLISFLLGMRVRFTTLFVSFLPVTLLLGPLAALGVCAALLSVAAITETVFSVNEKQELVGAFHRASKRLWPLRKPVAAPMASAAEGES